MPTPHTKLSVDVESPLLDRFREVYPQHGAMKWFFNTVLRNFLEIHDPERIHEEISMAVDVALESFEEDEG